MSPDANASRGSGGEGAGSPRRSGGAPGRARTRDGANGAPPEGRFSGVVPVLSAEFADELRNARRRVTVLEEANQAIQESMDRLTSLSSFSEGLDRSVTAADVAELLFEEVRGILPQEVMLLALLNAEGYEFRPVKTAPVELAGVASQELEAQIASGMFGWAIGLRRPTMVSGVHLQSNLIMVPLTTTRRTVGMLLVGTPLAADGVEQQHLTLVGVVARQSAECIDNLWLAESIRRQHEAGRVAAEAAAARRVADLGLLVETAGILSANQERDGALRFLVEATCRHLGVKTVVISIRESNGRLSTAYSAGLPSACVTDAECPAREACLLERVARQRAPVMIVHAEQDPHARACSLLQAAGVVSFLGVPLVGRGGPIGVLSVMTDSRREFAPEEVALLTGLAAQGASAIENAQLFADVQERMEHQQRALARLVQSAHLASVGVMAGGIAHDINNPLCIISNHLQLLRLRRDQMSPEVETALTSIESSVHRIAGSIEALLEYARVRPGERQRTDLNAAIRRILLLLQYHPMCRRVRVVTDFTADLPAVQLDRAAWEQVLLELLNNACEAMADNGTVRIRTRCLGGGRDGHATEGPAAGGSGVEVTVEDDGPGITPEEIARAFDPFFTTKAAKRGVGIGLKICRDIVHEHGGGLRVERGDPVGTRVVIELPVLADALPSESPDGARADSASGENDTNMAR